MEEKLDLIIFKIDSIEKRLDRLESSSEKLDNHISFVESVYNYIRGFANKFYFILPNIEEKKCSLIL